MIMGCSNMVRFFLNLLNWQEESYTTVNYFVVIIIEFNFKINGQIS